MTPAIKKMIEALSRAELEYLITALDRRFDIGIRASEILHARHEAAQDAADKAFSNWRIACEARTLAQGEALAATFRFSQAAQRGAPVPALKKLNRDSEKSEDALRAAAKTVDRFWNAYTRHSERASRLLDQIRTAQEQEF